MRAGIIGCNWGLVHLGALRMAGVVVEAICGRDADRVQELAQREGIARWHTNPGELTDLDLIIIATPAATHDTLIALFAGKWVICEKPLLGVERPLALAAALPASGLWINYAFAFLDTARLAEQTLARLGPVRSVTIESAVNLPLTFTWPQWFLEVASHPLSWILHLLGGAHRVRQQPQDQGYGVELAWQDGAVGSCRVTPAAESGICHRVLLKGDDFELSFEGVLVWGQPWFYTPVMLNGFPLNHGEGGDQDCWIRANQRAVATMVAVMRGQMAPQDALASGLFDVAKALRVEAVMLPGSD